MESKSCKEVEGTKVGIGINEMRGNCWVLVDAMEDESCMDLWEMACFLA